MRDILNPAHSDDKINSIVEELVPLAKLDGAVLIRVNPDGIFCEAACQVIPIVKWKTETNPDRFESLPLDIFNVPSGASDDELPNYDYDLTGKERFTLDQLKRLAGVLRGSHDYKEDRHAPAWLDALSFLNSAGTRHHSLWGITVSAEEPLFTVTISADGHLRLFCDGMVVFGPNEGSPKPPQRRQKGK